MQISRYERGLQVPNADRLLELARVLHISVDGLLAGTAQEEHLLDFKNVRLYERLRQLDDLPREDQDVVLKLIDAVIAKHRISHALRGQ